MPTSTTAGKKEWQKRAGNLVSVVRQSILSLFTAVWNWAACVLRRIPNLFTAVWNWAACVRRITVNGLIVVFVLVLIPLLVILEMVRYPNMIVDPMSVPPELVSMGYTPEVVARRLTDSIREFGDDEVPIADTSLSVSRTGGGTIMDTIGLEHNSPELDFVVPTIGLSIKSIAAYLNELLHPICPRIRVSGELLHVESDKRVFLRLRINKEKVADIHTSPGEINEEKMNKLFHDAAYQVIKNFDSSVLANIYNNQGVALAGKDDDDGAIEKFKKAIELNPEFASAYNNWGVALAEKGGYDAAIEKYRKAIELDPESASAYNNWGVALAREGGYDAAIEKYRKAIELDPESASAYNNWGVVLAGKGDDDGAIEKYRKAIELAPEDSVACRNWGAALAEKGDCEKAADMDCELSPDDLKTICPESE